MHSKMSSAVCLNLDQSKILSSGNGLSSVWLKWCIYFVDSGENINGENAGYQHFSFLQCFQKDFFPGSLRH